MGCCQSGLTETLLVRKSNYVRTKQGKVQASYEILESLGRGSFGVVSKVKDRKTGLEKAMKEFERLNVPQEKKSLISNEINILKDLDHPNIMKIFEVIESEKSDYIICECLTGGNLLELLKKKKKLPEEKVREIMYDVLSGLSYLHSHQVVHSDLKLENLVLESKAPDSRVKIVDFGLSRKMALTPITGKLCSSNSIQLNYIAPEVLSGEYNEKVDIWSAGVILYLLISGIFPFKNEAEEKYLARIQNQTLDFSKRIWSKVSSHCKDLLQRMLNPNVEKRISAIRALKHPWIKAEAENSMLSIQSNLYENLKSFRMLTQKEESPIALMFRALDIDGNGKLSKQELIECGNSLKAFTATEAEEIFENCDMDRSGFIDYNEFIVATMSRNEILTNQKAQMVFNYFENCGKLSLDELKNCFTNISDQEWKEFLLQVDQNKDGDISLQEFKEYLIKTIIS